jgi:hypothetical protein
LARVALIVRSLRFGVRNREERPGCIREIALMTATRSLHAVRTGRLGQNPLILEIYTMKKIFSHENLMTLGFVIAAVVIAVIVVIPIIRAFVPASLLGLIPGSKPATTTTTPAPTS